MVDFIQFWSIQESDLHKMPWAQYLTSYFETHTQETAVHTISNEFFPTSFLFSMNNL
jgi:hypothetical protein